MSVPRFLDAFRFAADVARKSATSPAIASPWSTSTLTTIVAADLFPDTAGTGPVTRAAAMAVPSFAKGRALICGTLARQPLAKYRGAAKVDPEAWMYRTSTAVSPQERMLWTLDDLIWNGMSLWAVERGAQRILDAVRVPPEWWEITPDLEILVNGAPVEADQVVLFNGPQDGLLTIAADTIRAARAMELAWRDRVESPAPMAHIKTTDPNANLSKPEADALVAAWEDARRHGGTAYTPAGIDVSFPAMAQADLFVNGRNAIRLDAANFLNLPGSLLDGSTATASLTYSTQEGRRNELVDYSLGYWALPIEARLSQDDVTNAGNRVAFDLAYLSTPVQPATGPVSED